MASSDIVERLREREADMDEAIERLDSGEMDNGIMRVLRLESRNLYKTAADEIERLRAEVEALRADAVIMDTPVNPVTLRDVMRAVVANSKCPHDNPWGECNDCDVEKFHGIE